MMLTMSFHVDDIPELEGTGTYGELIEAADTCGDERWARRVIRLADTIEPIDRLAEDEPPYDELQWLDDMAAMITNWAVTG